MKVLAIKPFWASMIAEGKKTIEVRSRSTNTRGKIAIYASRATWESELNISRINHFPSHYAFPTGAIIATADLFECFKFVDNLQFGEYNKHHHVLDAYPSFVVENTYAWCLCNVQKLEQPITFKMPKGCVVWANYEGEL